MIRLTGTVEYEGGRRQEFAGGSAAFVAWEAYARRHELDPYDGKNPNTLSAYVAYAALGVAEGFDVWIKSVVDVDVNKPPDGADNAAAAVDPTRSGTYTRLMVELAMVLGRPLRELQALDDAELATYVDVLERRSRG